MSKRFSNTLKMIAFSSLVTFSAACGGVDSEWSEVDATDASALTVTIQSLLSNTGIASHLVCFYNSSPVTCPDSVQVGTSGPLVVQVIYDGLKRFDMGTKVWSLIPFSSQSVGASCNQVVATYANRTIFYRADGQLSFPKVSAEQTGGKVTACSALRGTL